jgi:hypothetical protein
MLLSGQLNGRQHPGIRPVYRGRDEDYSPPPREDPRHVEKSFVQKLGDLARVRRGVEQSGRDVYRGEIGGFA